MLAENQCWRRTSPARCGVRPGGWPTAGPVATGRGGRPGSGLHARLAGHLVEETQDGGELAVVVGDRHVEPDDQRLGALRAQALGDQRLRELRDELLGYPGGMAEVTSPGGVVLPLRYRRGGQELSLFSISAVVGTATDVTVAELAIEAFYPADAATAAALRSPG